MKISILAIVATIAMLPACSAGPSDGDFVQACMNQRGPQMVKVTDAMCKCAATFARQNLDPKLRQALVLDMQGRKQDAEALLEGMSFEARGEFAMKQFGMAGQCIGEAAAGR